MQKFQRAVEEAQEVLDRRKGVEPKTAHMPHGALSLPLIARMEAFCRASFWGMHWCAWSSAHGSSSSFWRQQWAS